MNCRMPPLQRTARSTRRHPLIVHSHLRWDFVWQRPQQLLSRFGRNQSVLFVEEPVFVDDVADARSTCRSRCPACTAPCRGCPPTLRGAYDDAVVARAHVARGPRRRGRRARRQVRRRRAVVLHADARSARCSARSASAPSSTTAWTSCRSFASRRRDLGARERLSHGARRRRVHRRLQALRIEGAASRQRPLLRLRRRRRSLRPRSPLGHDRAARARRRCQARCSATSA